MRYVRGSSDVLSFSRARRAQALNFADRRLFPIWAPRPQPEPSGSNQEKATYANLPNLYHAHKCDGTDCVVIVASITD